MNQKTPFLLALSIFLCAASTARAAGAVGPGKTAFPWGTVTHLTGAPADLERQVDALLPQIGKVISADTALADRKGPLLRIVFSDIGLIQMTEGVASFVGRRLLGQGIEFAQVRFPGDIELSAHAAAVVIGSVTGKRKLAGLDGQKMTVPVVSARLVGVIDGGTFGSNGLLTFPPDSPIRLYQLKSPGKNKAAK